MCMATESACVWLRRVHVYGYGECMCSFLQIRNHAELLEGGADRQAEFRRHPPPVGFSSRRTDAGSYGPAKPTSRLPRPRRVRRAVRYRAQSTSRLPHPRRVRRAVRYRPQSTSRLPHPRRVRRAVRYRPQSTLSSVSSSSSSSSSSKPYRLYSCS